MDQLFHQLKPHSNMRLVRKGANILFQGEIPRSALIVRDGVVRAYAITSSGEERVVALYGKGDVFPLTWVLGETSNTLFYYDALTDVRLMAVPKPIFMSTLMKDTELLSAMLRFVGNQYTALLLRVTGLEQSRAVEKIGFTLYYLLFRYGEEKKSGEYVVDIKISQILLASFVGLTRESIVKNLKILKDKGVIDYDKSIYTINKVKLEQFLGEDGFRDVTI
jgi:CRP-like cAMP-binding protein